MIERLASTNAWKALVIFDEADRSRQLVVQRHASAWDDLEYLALRLFAKKFGGVSPKALKQAHERYIERADERYRERAAPN